MAIVAKILNEDVFSFIIRSYGDLAYVDTFLMDNDIDDISYFSTVDPGTEFIINIVDLGEDLVVVNIEDVPEPREVKVLNQNIFDFVLTHYGNLSFLQTFLDENDITSIHQFENTSVGTSFAVTRTENTVLSTYDNLNYIVSTGIGTVGDFNDDFNNDYLI